MRTHRPISAGLLALSLFAGAALAADKTGNVRGIVYNENGKPLEDATVRLLHRNDDGKLGEVDTATTSRDGKFQFDDVRNGTYVVVATTDRSRSRDRTTITVRDGDDLKGIELKPRKREAEEDERDAKREDRRDRKERGAAADADLNYSRVVGAVSYNGKPVREGTVKLLSGHDTDYDKMRVITTVETDRDGEYKFPRVQQGDYTLYIKSGGHVGTKRITINSNQRSETQDITLR